MEKVGKSIYLPFDERRKKKFVVGTRRELTGKYKGEHHFQGLSEGSLKVTIGE